MTQTQTQTRTPERELSKQLREVLRHVRSGKTPSEIAKKRKVTPNAVYSAFRRLEELGYADELPARNGKASGNGKARASTAAPNATEVSSGIENALTAVVSQREALNKTIENLTMEATDHETKATALRAEAQAHGEEVAVLTKMEEVANSAAG